jgi:X-X-X-Leu-X-X-Gly heptad repeat protein
VPLPAGTSRGITCVTDSCRPASKTRTLAQKLAIAVLALLLVALLGFYTLVTGRITDGSAKLKDGAAQASAGAGQLEDGAGKLANGASLADTGAGKLSVGAEKIYSGISSKLAPEADKLQAGAGDLAAGAVKIETDVNSKLAPGVDRVDDGAQKLAAGAVQLSVVKDKIAKITAGAHKLDTGASQLQAGAQRLQDGAGQLRAGTGKLTAGFATLAGKLNSQDPSSPGVVLGTRGLRTLCRQHQAGARLLAAGHGGGQTRRRQRPDCRRHGDTAFRGRRGVAHQHARAVRRRHGPGTRRGAGPWLRWRLPGAAEEAGRRPVDSGAWSVRNGYASSSSREPTSRPTNPEAGSPPRFSQTPRRPAAVEPSASSSRLSPTYRVWPGPVPIRRTPSR